MNAISFTYYVNLIIIWYFIIFNLCYVVIFFTSITDILQRYKEITFGHISLLVNSKIFPPVTAIIPTYNEGTNVLGSIMSLIRESYPNLKICVINDGSSDDTMPILLEIFQLREITPIILKKIKCSQIINLYVSDIYPNLTVINKEHTGKPDTLNVGINACTTPFFLTTDSDSFIEPESVSTLVYSLLSRPHTISVGGAVNVLNACKIENGELIEKKISLAPLVALQTSEYLRAFLFGRTGWNYFGGPLVLSGAITLFETQAVVEVGGYKVGCPGEDMEVVVHLHEYMRKQNAPRNNIIFTPAASAWTNVPTSMGELWSQRDRWHRGLIDSLLLHFKMCFNPRYGWVGLFNFPFQLFGEFLAPLVEIIGYVAIIIALYFNILDWHYAVLFFVATLGFATILSMATILLAFISFSRYDKLSSLFYLFVLVIFENIGYRQFLSVCRTVATIRYFLIKLKQKITGSKKNA